MRPEIKKAVFTISSRMHTIFNQNRSVFTVLMEGQIWLNNCITRDGDAIYYWHRESTDFLECILYTSKRSLLCSVT